MTPLIASVNLSMRESSLHECGSVGVSSPILKDEISKINQSSNFKVRASINSNKLDQALGSIDMIESDEEGEDNVQEQ